MPIIREYAEVKEIYRKAAERKWVIPCFCSENLTTTEAVLSAAQEFAEENKLPGLPVSLAITVNYAHRSQARYYTHTGKWDTGLKLFRADAETLMDSGGPFPNVDLLLHLDHIQHDADKELLDSDLSGFSSIMYDASALPFEENIIKTREFVQKSRGCIVIEGACDEISNASDTAHNGLTTPDSAERYAAETGVDMIVANLGTEHRALANELKYHDGIARAIRDRIGSKIVLHGLSSVSKDQLHHLFDDGICKVNIWTMLERDSSPVLLREMLQNAGKVAGENARRLVEEGLISEKADVREKAAISHFTTAWRQEIVFREMKRMIRDFFDMWY